MSFDNNANLIADNAASKGLNNTNDDHALRFHDDAYIGLMRSPKLDTQVGKVDISELFDKPGESGIVKVLEPSAKDRADAEKKLEKGMSKLIPEADRAVMKDMTTALTNGDSKAFAEALKKVGNDPEKLKDLVDEVNKALEAKGCATKIDVTGDGKVLVSDSNNRTAVAFDPVNGKTELKRVEHGYDGSVTVLPGEVLHVSAADTFEKIGNSAVDAINRGPGFNFPKIGGIEEPINKPEGPIWGGPIKPWNEPTRPWFEPIYSGREPEKPSPFKPWMLENSTSSMDLDMDFYMMK